MQRGRQILVQRLDDRLDELEQLSAFHLFGPAIDRGDYGLPAGSLVTAQEH